MRIKEDGVRKDLFKIINKYEVCVEVKNKLKRKLSTSFLFQDISEEQFDNELKKLSTLEFFTLVDSIIALIDLTPYYNIFESTSEVSWLSVLYNIIQQEKFNKTHGN